MRIGNAGLSGLFAALFTALVQYILGGGVTL